MVRSTVPLSSNRLTVSLKGSSKRKPRQVHVASYRPHWVHYRAELCKCLRREGNVALKLNRRDLDLVGQGFTPLQFSAALSPVWASTALPMVQNNMAASSFKLAIASPLNFFS